MNYSTMTNDEHGLFSLCCQGLAAMNSRLICLVRRLKPLMHRWMDNYVHSIPEPLAVQRHMRIWGAFCASDVLDGYRSHRFSGLLMTRRRAVL
jgi:hypothetical protein